MFWEWGGLPVQVTIIGAGSWGTALAYLVASKGHRVVLWSRRNEVACEINRTRVNATYLPVTLPPCVRATSCIEEAIDSTGLIILTVPSQNIRGVLMQITGLVDPKVPIVHGAKGIEISTQLRISQVAEEVLGRPIAALSGPNHAEEVASNMPTASVVAFDDLGTGKVIQEVLSTDRFRVYVERDVVGVELGGALKNVIALAAGISDGLGYGDNTKAALITRGLAEIVRLGARLGAEPLTLSGLSGLGDLVATCSSKWSRNRNAGEKIGKGCDLQEVLAGPMVVEGVYTTTAACRLAETIGVELPIASTLERVLGGSVSPKAAVDELMTRQLKLERPF